MPRKATWEAYAEFAGGRVSVIKRGTTREEAERLARIYVEYDAHEMGEPVEELARDENKTVWATAGTICGAYREWED